MTKRQIAWGVFIAIIISVLPRSPAFADGIIIPEPPICDPGPCPPSPKPMIQLAIEYHHVSVDIDQQVATTHVDQVFRNDNSWPVEGVYVFPIPPSAMVSEFALWVDGERVEAELLDRDEARGIYEQIVRRMRDPALLEYMDGGAVRASVFPIQPGGTRRIELEYTQVLTAQQGLIHYLYPLNTEKFSTQPLEAVSVSVAVDSADPVRAIYSPSHSVDILREGDHQFRVGYEDDQVKPDRDFELYYSVAEDDIGLNLVTYREPEGRDPAGFFLLLAAPSVEIDPDRIVPKDVFFVLDQSGSMEGEKFRQAQQALHYVLNNLNPDDRFNIVAFSTGTRWFAGDLEGGEAVPDARRWVDSLSAKGSTDINRALLEAAAQASDDRTTTMIFLTDGLPTEGVTESDLILENVRSAAPEGLRVFAFGVGYDVDTFLLDSLAGENGGITSYVKPGENLGEVVSSFYSQINNPVLTDLALDFGDVIPFDMYPSELPDLFVGNQLVLVGRYREPGSTTLRLMGEVEGDPQVFRYEDEHFRSSGGSDFLPRLWATRKIGALLQQVRLGGPNEELIDQIVRLSIRYGVVTPYTSYLVTAPEVFGEEAQDDLAKEALEQFMAAPSIVTGQEAVDRAAAENELGAAEAPVAPGREAQELVKIAGTRTFRLTDGVWIDTGFEPEAMNTLRVPFLSEDYFELAEADSNLAAAFALGERVIVISNGKAYQIVASDEEGDPITIPDPEEQTPVSVSQVDTQRGSGGATQGGAGLGLPCPGAIVGFGILFAPFLLAQIPLRGETPRRGISTETRASDLAGPR